MVGRAKSRRTAQDLVRKVSSEPVLADWLLRSEPEVRFPCSGTALRESLGYSVRAAFDEGPTEFSFHELYIPLFRSGDFILGYDFFPDMNAYEAVFHVEESGATARLEVTPEPHTNQPPRFALDLGTCTIYTSRHHLVPRSTLAVLCITMLEFVRGAALIETMSLEAPSVGKTYAGNYIIGNVYGSNNFYGDCVVCGAEKRLGDYNHCSPECDLEIDSRSARLSGWGEFRQLVTNAPCVTKAGLAEIRKGPSQTDIVARLRSSSSFRYGSAFAPVQSVLRWLFLGSIRVLDIHPAAANAALSIRMSKEDLLNFRRATHYASLKNSKDLDDWQLLLEGPAGDMVANEVPDIIRLPVPGDDKKRFVCSTCGSRFVRRNQAREHVQTVHRAIKPFTCNLCNRQFGLAHNLARHVRAVHENQRLKACGKCGARFNAAYSLRRHMEHVHRDSDGSSS